MPQTQSHTLEPVWTSWEKILFRFFVLFFGLYIFPSPLDFLPFVENLFKWVFKLWDWLVIHTGKSILHLSYPITVRPNGSGDTTWNYVQMFSIFSLSILGCLTWSIVDRKRANYNRLHYWFTVAVRYYLAYTLIAYGFYKVYKTQFPAPNVYRLTETYGQSSPMGLAWAFLGFSRGYNYFMGFAEVVGGLLILFRKSQTFGSLFCMTVTSNVMAINYCYDVPVKLFSTMLFLMAVYIAAPELNRLLKFFFLNQTTSLRQPAFRFATKWKRITAYTFKSLLLLYFLVNFIQQGIADQKAFGDQLPKASFYGYYKVENFVRNRDTLAPLLTDTLRWKNIIFSNYNRASIKKMNDTLIGFTYKEDTILKRIILTQREDTLLKYSFAYSKGKVGTMDLKGFVGKDSVSLLLSKIDLNGLLLNNRGFNWINEYPLNR